MASIAERVRAVVEEHRGDRGALMPILHDLQEEFGYIADEMVPALARELNLSRADVHGVVTFYTDFRSEPAGTTVVKLCRAEACQSVGAERVVAHAEQTLGSKLGKTTADGAVTVEQVFCLGNCALGPAAQVNGRMYGHVTPERFDSLIAEAKAEHA
ncbi:formate dehydrogenase subunit gamma [Amycolatopsis suaedae]|uniref:Formate dehydrogenase subunit gamma n=1 Tax=Amycolatopsis suaedae TaxID=2510978 RepID=A0A4Q7J2B4_9PSEU|nr:formate dehydrogenase subunit gamma [Amycolatopsis suaedae]RZQ60084.1 formate dehydrogenase subunit gamma [Amycolatopsis suaedae]